MIFVRRYIKNIVEFLNRLRLNLSKNYYIENNVRMMHSSLEKYVSISKGCNIVWSEIGKYTYLGQNTELPYCRIGRYCSIASHVILAEGRHPTAYVSTHPLLYGGMGYRMRGGIKTPHVSDFKEHVSDEKFVCTIGNDVWISTGVMLVCRNKPLKIGNSAIIAAGALVLDDVPDYAIVAGCPAKVIKYRFNEEQRRRLMESQWWNKDDKWMNQYIELFDDVDQFLSTVENESKQECYMNEF